MEPRNIILAFLLLVLLILPASAETLSGTLGGTGDINSTTYDAPVVSGGGNQVRGLQFKDVEKIQGLTALIGFEKSVFTYDADAPPGSTANFVLYLATSSVDLTPSTTDTTIKGTGTIGYQRYFNGASPPVEQPGYFWLVISGFNNTGLSGTKQFSMVYNHNDLYNMTAVSTCQPANIPTGTGAFLHAAANNKTVGGMPALYTMNKESDFVHYWSATKPSGIGISGGVSKNGFNSRVFISNISNVPVTSDNLFNSNTFNFSVPDQAIYISALDTYGNWYNTSMLFSSSTPTPTPTPSPSVSPTVPPGTTWSTITWTIKNSTSDSNPVPNAFAKIERYSGGSFVGDVAGYTDSNGKIIFYEVPVTGYTHKFIVIKPGYYTYSSFIDPIPVGSWSLTTHINPDLGENPEVPMFVDISLQVKSDTTFTPLSGAYVSIEDTIYGTATQAQYTNATGWVFFENFPATAYIGGQITKSGYVPYTWWLGDLPVADTTLVKYIHLTSSEVTPTITPQEQVGITLTATPDSVNPGDTVSLTTTCSNATACTAAGGLKFAIYAEYQPNGISRGIGYFKYNATSAAWEHRYNNSLGAWDTGSFNPLTFVTSNPTISGDWSYQVSLINQNEVSLGTATDHVLVTGAVSAQLNMHFGAISATTGSHLMNYQMNLTNLASGEIIEEWPNVAYDETKVLPRSLSYKIQCSKAGYLDGETTFTVPISPDIVDGDFMTYEACEMFPTGSISAGNTTVSVKVFDFNNGIPIPGVQVSVGANPIYSTSPQYTGGSGEGVYFIIGQNTDYQITLSKSGYCSVTETGNTGTQDSLTETIWMKSGPCGGVTPTTTVTTIPGQTPSGVVTPTPFQPGNATSFWDPWVNVYRLMGANDSEIPNLIAGLIIILCMAAGAGMAGVLGAEVGMGFGAIFCVSIGLIPIWMVLAIIVLGFLFYGLKIGR